MRKKEIFEIGIMSILFILFFVARVSAFGVSSDGVPYYLMPGESKDITFRLQNMVGEEDYSVYAEITSGSGFAKITDESNRYSVPLGVNGVKVNLRLSVPASAKIGQQQKIDVSFTAKPLNEGSSGNPVSIGSSIVSSALIIVGKDPSVVPISEEEKPTPNKRLLIYLIVLLLLIIVAALIYLSVKKRKRR